MMPKDTESLFHLPDTLLMVAHESVEPSYLGQHNAPSVVVLIVAGKLV